MSIGKNFRQQILMSMALLFFCLFSAFSFAIYGQQPPPINPQRGFYAGGSFALSDIENINMTNGNLMLNFPLANLPTGRGEVGASINLTYNSKILDARSVEIYNSLAED